MSLALFFADEPVSITTAASVNERLALLAGRIVIVSRLVSGAIAYIRWGIADLSLN